MVVVEILGVVKDVELLNNKVPPEAAEYQSMVDPEGAVADKDTVPAPHRELGNGDVGALGRVLTVTIIAPLVAEQLDAFVTTTVYDPLVLAEYEEVVAPERLEPSFFH